MKHTDGISDVAILGMGTALPVHSVAQSDIADLIASGAGSTRSGPLCSKSISILRCRNSLYLRIQLPWFIGRMPLSAFP